MSESYIYQKSATANGDVNTGLLQTEINALSLTPSLVSVIDTGQSEFVVVFDGFLSGSEKTQVDSAVASHEGESPEQIQLVRFETKNESNKAPQVAIVEADGEFESFVTHNFADNTTWPATNNSTWVLSPPSGKRYQIKRAEAQFQHDVQMSGITELYFDVWAFDPQNLPNKALVERKTYASIRDVLNVGNAHYTMVCNGVDGINGSLSTVQFDYPRAIILNSSQGAEIRCSLKNNVAVTGTWITVSFVVGIEDEN